MELNDMMKRGWRLLAICLLVLAGGTAVADPSVCVDCHEGEVAEWSRSQHAVAMAEASPEAVAGDFSGARYQDSELAVQFLEKDGQFVIHTREGDEKRQWTVRYTFGVYPLQQYLIDIGDGRDRKSTRLNSSHVRISYAVFCLK